MDMAFPWIKSQSPTNGSHSTELEGLRDVESTPLLDASLRIEEDSIPTARENCLLNYNGSNHDNSDGHIKRSIRNLSQSFRQLSRRMSDVVAEHTGSIGYLGSYAIAVSTMTSSFSLTF